MKKIAAVFAATVLFLVNNAAGKDFNAYAYQTGGSSKTADGNSDVQGQKEISSQDAKSDQGKTDDKNNIDIVIIGPSEIELDVIEELNLARRNPQYYAENIIAKYVDRYAASGPETFDEVRKECIAEMRTTAPMGELTFDYGLWKMATYHVETQGPTGNTGHTREDGTTFSDNIDIYSKDYEVAGENISYGSETARDVVVQLLVDDNVASRGHRKNILNPEYSQAGVSFGPHQEYETTCVIDFAHGWVDKASY